MTIIQLYRYEEGGGVSISPRMPAEGVSYTTEWKRLVADEGKVLTNGEAQVTVIDTTNPDEWSEEDAPEPESEDE